MSYYLEAYLVEEDFEHSSGTGKLSGIGEKGHLPIYNSIREVLSPEYKNLSDAEIEAMLRRILGRMSPEEVEGFWDTLKDIGKAALGATKQAAPTILPMAGGALGTLVGGPAGTVIGGKLGQMGAQLLAKPQKLSASPRATPQPPPSSQAPQAPSAPAAAPVPPGGTSVVAQLMSLIKNPDLLKSLLGQLLGGAGESTVRVGPQATPIPFGAMMNALESLASQAAVEAAEAFGDEESVEAMGYLQDESGNSLVDPANPDERAQRVLSLLNEARETPASEPYDPVTGWLIEANLL